MRPTKVFRDPDLFRIVPELLVEGLQVYGIGTGPEYSHIEMNLKQRRFTRELMDFCEAPDEVIHEFNVKLSRSTVQVDQGWRDHWLKYEERGHKLFYTDDTEDDA